jgi:cation diffusion facilitator CzcD-associated flavoprotein CzcO
VERVVIVGAGPAGLAIAAALRRRGVDPLIVERGSSVATSWRGRHDRLRLNTHRVFSHQPGRRIPRRLGPFPRCPDYVDYLESCAFGMRIRFDTDVVRVERTDHGWRFVTDDGAIEASQAIIATGPDLVPAQSTWPGADTFTGTLVHAGAFVRLDEAIGRDVLVVGPGNSGVDLLNHLVRLDTGRLWLSARSGQNIVPARLAGVPLHPVAVLGRRLPAPVQDATLRMIQRVAFGDLSRFGYPRSELGAISRVRLDDVAPAIDDGFVGALKAGRVLMTPAIARLAESDVHFVDGTVCQPEIIICATGYRPGLEPLVGDLVELDRLGRPPFTGPAGSPAHPGLWFFGLNRSPYGNMHIRRGEARRLAKQLSA